MCELKRWNYIARNFIICNSSRYSISVITWRRTQWVGYIMYMGKMRNLYKILVGKCDGQRTLGILVIGEWVMLNRILTKLFLRLLAGCNQTLGKSLVACSCECYNLPVSCMKGGWFLDHMTVGFLKLLSLGWTIYSFLMSLQVDPLNVLGPPKCGRRVTILGDTSDSSKMVDLAQWVPSKLYVTCSITISFFP